MTGRVLITGARAPVAVDLGRAFDAAGYEPHFADSVTPWAARWSKAARGQVHRLPPPRSAFPAYADALARWVEKFEPVAIIPTCEEVFYLAAASKQRGFADRVFAPSIDTLRRLHSKIHFPEFARGIGIPAAETWRVECSGDIASLPVGSDQLVFKPEYSRFGTATLLRPSERRLQRLKFTLGEAWAAQRYVHGKEICLWAAAVDGRIVACAVYRPVWRHGHTAAYAFELVDCPAAVSVAEKVATATGMTGHLSFDFILTPEGDAVPIECNPRAVSGLHLFDASATIAHALMGDGPAIVPVAGIRYLAPAMIALGLPAAAISGRLPQLIRDWRAGQDVVGRLGDRLPVAGALFDAALFALSGLMHLRSPAAQTTDDIEWNGELLT